MLDQLSRYTAHADELAQRVAKDWESFFSETEKPSAGFAPSATRCLTSALMSPASVYALVGSWKYNSKRRHQHYKLNQQTVRLRSKTKSGN